MRFWCSASGPMDDVLVADFYRYPPPTHSLSLWTQEFNVGCKMQSWKARNPTFVVDFHHLTVPLV